MAFSSVRENVSQHTAGNVLENVMLYKLFYNYFIFIYFFYLIFNFVYFIVVITDVIVILFTMLYWF